MSHAMGCARFQDGSVLFFEYNGTSDVVQTALKRSAGDVERDWRSPANDAECACGGDEPVELMTYYGDGFSWFGRACPKCMAITRGTCVEGPECTPGIPKWAGNF